MADFSVDPDEFADAVRDGMTAGGADAAEANVEAELGRITAIAHNDTAGAQRMVLDRVDPVDVEWAAWQQRDAHRRATDAADDADGW